MSWKAAGRWDDDMWYHWVTPLWTHLQETPDHFTVTVNSLYSGDVDDSGCFFTKWCWIQNRSCGVDSCFCFCFGNTIRITIRATIYCDHHHHHHRCCCCCGAVWVPSTERAFVFLKELQPDWARGTSWFNTVSLSQHKRLECGKWNLVNNPNNNNWGEGEKKKRSQQTGWRKTGQRPAFGHKTLLC